jgi:hypothetical protein
MFAQPAARRAQHALAAIAAALVLGGCETGPTIRADQDPGANLSIYRTYGFVAPLSTDKAGYSTVLSSRLKQAVSREMDGRGYRYVESGGDLLINFFVNVEEKTEIRSYPTGPSYGGYYGYRGAMYGGWGGYDVQTVNYKAGTLSVDVVDAAKKQLVWTGIAEGRVSQEARDNPGAAIDRVIGEIFAKYPGRAAAQ